MTDKLSFFKRFATAFAALMLAACATASSSDGGRGEAMVVAANPHAVDAALEILREGGNATDAAIAAEMVLGLVEPQSSGVGGGGFMLHYDGASERIEAFDGREQAPAGATPTMLADTHATSFIDLRTGGVAIGGPSLIAMLKMAHDRHGRLPWARLFAPAERLADEGFAISPRMARLMAYAVANERIRNDPAARAYFLDEAGNAWPVGHILRNPEYAATMRAIAARGPRALSEGALAEAIVAAAQRAPYPGTLSLEDLRTIEPRRLEPVCGAFRVYRVCTMGPPSSANAVIAILGLYERARPHPVGASDPDDWAAFLWASRLAFADRDHYMADDQFVPVPTRELIAPAYLDERAQLIDLAHAPATAIAPGVPAGRELFERWGRDMTESSGTSHLSIVDRWGNAVSMTSTVESLFGAQRMVGGFFLNNQLTDFSVQPTLNGMPVANAVAPRKRPRSSMAPTIITDRDGELVLVIGSPGSSAIIGYVARSTIAILDWHETPQNAVAMGNVTARTVPARIEAQRLPPGILAMMQQRGWRVQESALEESGLHAILVTPQGLVGGADPRREGVVAQIPAAAH
ncbi:gamma-glutamyltransferase family protein [Terricaulis sp.]|uniref:gamma-glutamyltransferase family protein n=1 Tax=Terricaulis sp. TaxID=2768686 RepID=UPI003784AAEF